MERRSTAHTTQSHKRREPVVNDAALFRVIEALIDECPETLFSEQIADVLKVNREVLDA